jgi:hypothetical protein
VARLCLALCAGLAAIWTTAALAQSSRVPLTLGFAGFETGQSLAALAANTRSFDGTLVCKVSRIDRTLRECRATLHDSAGRSLALWLSAADSNASITTIEAQLSTAELLRWQGGLLTRYGRARERSRGAQRSLQWIRGNTMMRLTWRPEGGGVAASVSLIDGGRLDAWGRRFDARLPVRPAADSARPDAGPTASP